MQIDMDSSSDIKFSMRAPKAFFASEHLFRKLLYKKYLNFRQSALGW
jgi:hypothetical protein